MSKFFGNHIIGEAISRLSVSEFDWHIKCDNAGFGHYDTQLHLSIFVLHVVEILVAIVSDYIAAKIHFKCSMSFLILNASNECSMLFLILDASKYERLLRRLISFRQNSGNTLIRL